MRLGVTALSVLVALGVGVPLLSDMLARAAGRHQVAVRAALDVDIADGLHGLPDLLMLGRAGDQVECVRMWDRQLGWLQMRLAVVEGVRSALGDAVGRLGAWTVLLLAIPLVATNSLGSVYLATLALLVLGAAEALQPLGLAALQLGRTRAAAQRLWQVADERPAIAFPTEANVILRRHDDGSATPRCPREADPSRAQDDTHLLEFDRVDFGYDGVPVLREISFALEPGHPVALVGPSGAGKSTLLHLAARAWDPTAGQVRLGGRDLRSYPSQRLGTMIGSLSQEAYLFSATVRHNLNIARPTATDDEMRDVLRRVGLNDLLAGLPEGLDTWVGDQGVRLSGGERQRLVFARALLQDSPILLLDEVTANLDPISEQLVFDIIQELARERTMLVATHRLGHLEWADAILVLEAGRIVERGPHNELLRSGGMYKRLLSVQDHL